MKPIMTIAGTVRSNILAAISSARRLKGRQVHHDTIQHWQRLLDHARSEDGQQGGEMLDDVIGKLESELAPFSKAEGGSGSSSDTPPRAG
jgi:hypothetical protein